MHDEFQPLVFHAKRSSAVWLLLICLAFTALGLFVALVVGEWPGWLIAGFFALGIPIAIVQLIPGSTYLEIDEQGFTMCTMYRKHRVLWSEVEEFMVIHHRQSGIKVNEWVGFNYRPTYDRARFGRKLARGLADCEGMLSVTYNMKAEDLVALLNECLARFGDDS